MISARRAEVGLALILAAMAASSLRSSARTVLAIAASAVATIGGALVLALLSDPLCHLFHGARA
jgi:hypothetical protein